MPLPAIPALEVPAWNPTHDPDRSVEELAKGSNDSGEIRAALIIPALNEEPVIGRTLSRVPDGLFRQVIVADNGSTDRTTEIARSMGATVVSTPQSGYGGACLCAMEALRADIEAAVFMQADGSEDPAEAIGLLRPISNGSADLVIGSRTLGKVEAGALLPHQQFGNALATGMIRLFFGHSYSDLGPFRAIRRSSLAALGMRERRYGWTVEMQVKALQKGLRVVEWPVTYKRRAAGENKISGNLVNSVKAGLTILYTVVRHSILSRM
jgi:glycosyltransferase involved in cell wall biosynthesis